MRLEPGGEECRTGRISRQLVVDALHSLPSLRHLSTSLRLLPLRPEDRSADLIRHPVDLAETTPRREALPGSNGDTGSSLTTSGRGLHDDEALADSLFDEIAD